MFLVFLFSIFLIIVYTIFEFNRIKKNLEKDQELHLHEVSKPIHVPLYVDPGSIRHDTLFHFTFDPPGALKQYREAEKLDQVVEDCKNDFETSLKLMKWSRSQWQPGRPDPYPPIDAREILKRIRLKQTGGFCAQYNYVFLQGLQSFGIFSRYVSIQHHEVTEVWIKTHNKWVCFDPLFDNYYTDEQGIPLSVLEISAAIKKGGE